jgi:hypothetical protein
MRTISSSRRAFPMSEEQHQLQQELVERDERLRSQTGRRTRRQCPGHHHRWPEAFRRCPDAGGHRTDFPDPNLSRVTKCPATRLEAVAKASRDAGAIPAASTTFHKRTSIRLPLSGSHVRPTPLTPIHQAHRYPGDRVFPGSAITAVRCADGAPRLFPPTCAGRGPASVTPIARTSRRSCRPLIGPLSVRRFAPSMDVFSRIHPQELNHGGVYAAKNDLSGVDYGEIAIGLPEPTREISVSSPSQGRRNGGWCLGKTATAVGHPRLDRTRRPTLPSWEQNGNRTGNISPMRLQCTCVRAVS